jgi:hypothetical protein
MNVKSETHNPKVELRKVYIQGGSDKAVPEFNSCIIPEQKSFYFLNIY